MIDKTHEKNLLIGISGSIAAYKSCDIIREMIRANWNVHVLMTENACRFITPMTLQTLSQQPVTVGLFDQIRDWTPGHISLADRADVLCIAPATANVIAKLACGIADDALTSVALAFSGPLIIAPAMNSAMYTHSATQANISLLEKRGATIIAAEEGALACGTTGPGRLAPIETIVSVITHAIKE